MLDEKRIRNLSQPQVRSSGFKAQKSHATSACVLDFSAFAVGEATRPSGPAELGHLSRYLAGFNCVGVDDIKVEATWPGTASWMLFVCCRVLSSATLEPA